MHNNSKLVMLFDKKFVCNSLRNYLKCPSCRNDFSINFQREHGTEIRSNRPVLLPCGHTMCENCIQQNFKNLVCAECSRPIPIPKQLWGNFKFRNIFELNFVLMGIIKHLSYYRSDGLCDSSILLDSENDKQLEASKMKNSTIFKCVECEIASAIGKCGQCNVDYCKKCFKTVHMNSKVLKSHSLMHFEIQQFHFQKPRPKKCWRHHKFCDQYCTKCHNSYCRACIKDDHNTHSHHSLAERNQHYMDEILTVLENVKQSRENVRKAQREIKSVESQFQAYATQTLEDIAHYFFEMHGLLQLEFRKIMSSFSQNCATPQSEMREAYNTLSERLNVLNKMRSHLESFQEPPTNIDLSLISQSISKKLNDIPSEVKISKIDKNPFVFEKLGDFKNDLHKLYSYKYEAPDFSVSIGPSYSNWQHKLYDPLTVVPKNVPMMHNLTPVSNEVLLEKTIDMELDTTEDLNSSMEELNLKSKQSIPTEFSLMLAQISYVRSPTYFFLTNSEALSVIREISLKYENVRDSDLIPDKIQMDHIYMGFHEPTKQWHRMVVTKEINEDLFKTSLVDIGGELEVKRKNIRTLDKSYASIAFAAMPCSLYNLEPLGPTWPKEAKEIMLDISRGNPVRVCIFGKNNNDIFNVDIFTTYGEEPISIRDAFLYMGLAREKPGSSVVSKKILIPPVASIARQLIKRNLHTGDAFTVKITHIESPMEFFIVRADHFDDKEKLSRDLNLDYNNKNSVNCKILYFGSLKMCCAVRFEDFWYRGSIEEIEKNGLIRVRFVDEGRTEIVKWSQLYELAPKFRNHKEFAIRCSLYELEPLQKNNYSWSKEAIEEFKILSSNPNIHLRVFSTTRNIYQVALYIQRKMIEINIGAVLVRKGHAISTGPTTQAYETPKKTIISIPDAQKQELLETLSNSYQQQQHQINLKALERVPIKIVHIVSPGEFYAYLNSLEAGVQLFHSQLQQSQEENENNNGLLQGIDNAKVWSIGDHCLVHTVYRSSLQPDTDTSYEPNYMIENNREWFRAIIVGITSLNPEDNENQAYTVFLRDRGATINGIMISQLRSISHIWDYVANSVQRCHLACLRPTGDLTTWSMSATDCLKHNVLAFNPVLATRQDEGTTAKRHSVPIFLWGMTSEPTDALAPSISKYTNINRILINMGLAIKSKSIVFTKKTDMIMNMGIDSNEISLDEWYQNQLGSLEEIERIATVGPKENDCSITEKIEAENLDLQEPVTLGDINTTPTWNAKIPDAWLKPKPIYKTLFTAYPTYVNHSAMIYLHEAVDRGFLDAMRTEMTKAYKDSPVDKTKLYSLGQPCVVRYHYDKQFYRGIVIMVDNRTGEYEVKFIDYGNKETVKCDELRPFAPFRNLNSFANVYRIEGIRPVRGAQRYSIPDLDLMHKILVDKLVSVRVQSNQMKKKFKYCSIRIGAEDFAQIIVREGRAEYNRHEKAASEICITPMLSSPRLDIDFLDNDVVEENCSFDLDDENADNKKELDAYMETFKKCAENVIGTKKENLEEISNSELAFELDQPRRPLPQSPKSNFKSSDFNGEIAGPTTYDCNEIQEKDYFSGNVNENAAPDKNGFFNLFDEQDEDVVILEESFISSYWQDQSAINIGDDEKDEDEMKLAVQWSHVKALQRAKSESSCEFENFCPQNASTSLSNFADIDMFKWPQLLPNVLSFRCNVSAVVSPTILYIFPHLEDFEYREKEIKRFIKQVIKTVKPLNTFTINTVCLACYSNDHNWYRAIIRSYDANALEAEVLFIDYWNTEKVSIKALKQCPLKLLDFPLRTLKVQLYGVRPSSRMRERDVCQALKNVLNPCEDLFVQVQKHPDDIKKTPLNRNPVKVYLFKSESSSNVIYYELIQQKYYMTTK